MAPRFQASGGVKFARLRDLALTRTRVLINIFQEDRNIGRIYIIEVQLLRVIYFDVSIY